KQEEVAARRREFLFILGRLELFITTLPADRNESRIRAVHGWKGADIERFLALAPSMGVQTAADAESAGPSLRWLLDRVRYVQGTRPETGFKEEELPAKDWGERLTLACKALQSIDSREIASSETPTDLKAPVS